MSITSPKNKAVVHDIFSRQNMAQQLGQSPTESPELFIDIARDSAREAYWEQLSDPRIKMPFLNIDQFIDHHVSEHINSI